MKRLYNYLIEDTGGAIAATPGNTVGMGNPTPPTTTTPGSEPLVPTAKAKKEKVKKKRYFSESILDDEDVLMNDDDVMLEIDIQRWCDIYNIFERSNQNRPVLCNTYHIWNDKLHIDSFNTQNIGKKVSLLNLFTLSKKLKVDNINRMELYSSNTDDICTSRGLSYIDVNDSINSLTLSYDNKSTIGKAIGINFGNIRAKNIDALDINVPIADQSIIHPATNCTSWPAVKTLRLTGKHLSTSRSQIAKGNVLITPRIDMSTIKNINAENILITLIDDNTFKWNGLTKKSTKSDPTLTIVNQSNMDKFFKNNNFKKLYISQYSTNFEIKQIGNGEYMSVWIPHTLKGLY